jgi:hypothetical protein
MKQVAQELGGIAESRRDPELGVLLKPDAIALSGRSSPIRIEDERCPRPGRRGSGEFRSDAGCGPADATLAAIAGAASAWGWGR